MEGYLGYNEQGQWARLLHTTLANHIRQIEEAFARNFVMLSQVMSAGRVLYNQSGNGIDWPVQYRIHNVEGNTGETQRNFARRNLIKKANLGWRGYQVTDAMYMLEFLMNRGPEAVVNVFNTFMEQLENSMVQSVSSHVWGNGNATNREKFWHGLDSMFQTNGTLKFDDGTQRAANAADLVAYPTGSYASINTELGNYGGENETGSIWPNGLASPQFDFWTPVIAITDSTQHPAATHTWAGQGDEVLRYAIIECQRNAVGAGMQVDTCVLSRDYYREFLNLLDNKEQIQITPGAQSGLRQLGFKNVVGFDGVEVTWEASVPTSSGYGYNINCIEMRNLFGEMWHPEPPEYDIHTQAFNTVLSNLGNLKFKSPRNFFKVIPSASA